MSDLRQRTAAAAAAADYEVQPPHPAWITIGVITALAFAAYIGLLFTPSYRPVWVGWINEAVPVLAPIVAGTACFGAARRSPRGKRASWILLGVGASLWAAGDLIYTALDRLGLDPTGAFTVADFGYLALIPAWVAALILHPSRPRTAMDMLGSSVEAIVVLVASAAVTWAFVLSPLIESTTDLSGSMVLLAYPVGDLALIGAFAALAARSELRLRSAESLLAAAVLVFALGDIFYARMGLTGSYETGSPIDMAWIVAFGEVALATRYRFEAKPRTAGRFERQPAPWLSVVGIGAVAALGLVAIISHERDVLIGGTVLCALLIVLRQGILLAERRSLVTELGSTVEALEEADRAKDAFIAVVSHDLRTPITVVRGFAQQLMRTNPERETLDEIATLQLRNVDRLRRMVEDLIAAGQFSAGRGPNLSLGRVDLAALARRTVAELGMADVSVSGDDTWAMADAGRVEQILSNLIGNAHQHGGTPIEVQTGTEEDRAFLRVRDHGPGIPPELSGRVFERFVSFGGKATSVGLGLWIVRMLAEAMGGEVDVTSELGVGTTFTVRLPAISY